MLSRNTVSRLAIVCLALTATAHAAELPGAGMSLPAAPSAPAPGVGAGAGLGAAPQLPALPALPALDAEAAGELAPVNAGAEGSRSVELDTLAESRVALPGLEGTQPLQSSTQLKRKLNVSYRVQTTRAVATKPGDLAAPGAALDGNTAADVQVDLGGNTAQQLDAAPASVTVGASDGALSRGVSVAEQSMLSAVPAAGEPLPRVDASRALKLTLDTRDNGSGERSLRGKVGDTTQNLERKARPGRTLQVQAESLDGSNRVETAGH